MQNQIQSLYKQALPYITVQNALIAGGTYFGLKVTSKIISIWKIKAHQRKLNQKTRQYNTDRKQKLKKIVDSIPESSLTPQFEEEILNASVQQIKDFLALEKLTSVQLLNLYAKRAYSIGLNLNIITESNYQEALETAKKCDELRKQNPQIQQQKELFGVVMSVKDNLDLKNTASTVGLQSRIHCVPKEDGAQVQVLKEAGAIIFVKSNLPQMGMNLESDNAVFGTCNNPWNIERTTGGSSGGEGGLIASRCSPLGIGNDIGGSIRCPAAFNGVTGFKMGFDRTPNKGQTYYADGYNGQQCIKTSIGPLAKYVDDNALLMKALINQENYSNLSYKHKDLYFKNKNWDQEAFTTKRKLKIGYIKSIDSLWPTPSCIQRTVQEAADALKKNGHELIPIKFPKAVETFKYYLNILYSEGTDSYNDMLNGEEIHQCYKLFQLLFALPQGVKSSLKFILNLCGQQRIGQMLDVTKKLDSYEYRKAIGQVDKIRQEFFEFCAEQEIEIILAPSFGLPAGKHKFFDDLPQPGCYTFLWNLINLPGGVLPVTVVQENEQTYDNELVKDRLYNLGQEQMKGSKGLPLNVQVLSMPNQEELCLNIMKQIEQNVEFHKKHSYPI